MILAFFRKPGQDSPNDGLRVSTVDNLQETATERFFTDVNCVFKALLP